MHEAPGHDRSHHTVLEGPLVVTKKDAMSTDPDQLDTTAVLLFLHGAHIFQ